MPFIYHDFMSCCMSSSACIISMPRIADKPYCNLLPIKMLYDSHPECQMCHMDNAAMNP